MEKKNKWYTSIWAIALFIYLFFPVGFYFLYARLKDKHGGYYAVTKMLLWIGILWGAFGVMYLGLSCTYETFVKEYLPAGIFAFIVPGGAMAFFGFKRDKKLKSFNKYIKYISARKKIKIDDLCNATGVDYDGALKDIEEMIAKQFINGYINDNELIIKSKDGIDYTYDDDSKKEVKVVKCKECGAKNSVVVGEKKECEYCGTLLQ